MDTVIDNTSVRVALLAEGVDRNLASVAVTVRAWSVALLAEGVDRNTQEVYEACRARVALLAEGVDRNIVLKLTGVISWSRPPRGGRG